MIDEFSGAIGFNTPIKDLRNIIRDNKRLLMNGPPVWEPITYNDNLEHCRKTLVRCILIMETLRQRKAAVRRDTDSKDVVVGKRLGRLVKDRDSLEVLRSNTSALERAMFGTSDIRDKEDI